MFADFGYGLAGGYPGFGPFAMVPPQWLDAAYMSYAWPEYFRRPTSADLCKLPVPPCSSITKGENLYKRFMYIYTLEFRLGD